MPEGEHLVPLGKADIKREGSDCTIVAWSFMVGKSLEAAEKLAAEGISAEVLDLRSLVPLDEEALLASVGRTGRLVIVHEAPERTGYGAEIAAFVAGRGFGSLKTGIRRVAARNVPLPMSPRLENTVLPQTEWIVDAVRAAVKGEAA